MTTDTFAFAGKNVRRVGFGAMQLPGTGVMGPPKDHDQAIAVLRRAVEAGVNHIDTAQFYGPNVSNELIREALYPYSDDLLLVSKVGARRNEKGDWLPALRPEQLREDVEENLKTLGVEQLGAVNLRRNDEHSTETLLADQLAEMVKLRDEGKIAGIGVSTVTKEQTQQAIDEAGIVCVQNAYSLLDQSDNDVLELCIANNIAYVPYFPLGSAFPHMPKVVDDEKVKAVADSTGLSPAQVGLAWLLARADNILLIPGTSSLAHLEENLDIADVQLSDVDLKTLNDR